MKTRTAPRAGGRHGVSRRRKSPAPHPQTTPDAAGATVDLLRERIQRVESTPALTGGDLDADWQRAASTGEEAVGGSVATPDQDIVDELGRALGVEQELEDEVRTSEEILRARDRHYWALERRAIEREQA